MDARRNFRMGGGEGKPKQRLPIKTKRSPAWKKKNKHNNKLRIKPKF